jgi:hypothetical protein
MSWPDKTFSMKGNVLFFRGEDSVEKTIKPRLIAQGADLSNVILLERAKDDRILTLHHTKVIADAMHQAQAYNGLPVRMVIIDPIADFLGETKENSNVEMRVVLRKLKRLAEKSDCSFLLIQHIGKADRDNVQQRVLGSTGIVASCRASFCLLYDKGRNQRVFAPMKNNLAVNPSSVVFSIANTPDGGVVEIIDADVDKDADAYANDLKREAQKKKGPSPSSLNFAIDWLKEFLSEGYKPVGSENDTEFGTIRQASQDEGLSWATIKRAKQALKIKPHQIDKTWYWCLSSSDTKSDAQNPVGDLLEHLEND